MRLKFGRSPSLTEASTTYGVDIEVERDTVAVYQVENQSRTSRFMDRMTSRPKPKPIRDPDHNPLFWMFGRRRNVVAIESPKPLGKRAKRRARGRLKEERRIARARLANYIWEF